MNYLTLYQEPIQVGIANSIEEQLKSELHAVIALITDKVVVIRKDATAPAISGEEADLYLRKVDPSSLRKVSLTIGVVNGLTWYWVDPPGGGPRLCFPGPAIT